METVTGPLNTEEKLPGFFIGEICFNGEGGPALKVFGDQLLCFPVAEFLRINVYQASRFDLLCNFI